MGKLCVDLSEEATAKVPFLLSFFLLFFIARIAAISVRFPSIFDVTFAFYSSESLERCGRLVYRIHIVSNRHIVNQPLTNRLSDEAFLAISKIWTGSPLSYG